MIASVSRHQLWDLQFKTKEMCGHWNGVHDIKLSSKLHTHLVYAHMTVQMKPFHQLPLTLHHITRTSEWCIPVWRSRWMFLSRDISWVQRTNVISLHKNNEPDLQIRIHHSLVLVILCRAIACFDWNLQIQISSGDSVLHTTFC